MERTYKARYELLTEKERHATDKLQKTQEVKLKPLEKMISKYFKSSLRMSAIFLAQMQDMETYQQRQSVLDELEILRQREASLKRQEEMNKRLVC